MTKGDLRVLIVDDDKDDVFLTQNFLREGLKGVTLDVDVAHTFVQGLSRAEKNRYDVLLFDYQLGAENGLDLMREVRAKGIDTPVVFLTGRGDEEVAVEAMKLGAADYLPKSKLSEGLVRRTVRYAVELHEKEQMRQRMEQDLRRMNFELDGWVKELERRSRESYLLNDFGNALQTCVTLSEAYALIARRIPDMLPGRSGALFMFDSSRMVTAVAVWGDAPPEKLQFPSDECWALRRTRLYGVCDAKSEIRCEHLRGSAWQSDLCVPMMAYGESLGLLVLEGSGAPQDTNEQRKLNASKSEFQFAETVSEHLALALANLKLREALRSQAIHDSLTGLFNRRYMEEFLERATASASRHRRPLTLLMLDIDHFKVFNDAYGHQAGDAMLRYLAQFLHGHTRGEDIACRWGGEEFVLILPEVPLGVAAQRAEQLRAGLKNTEPQANFPWPAMPTISIGIAAAPEHGFAAHELLRVADQALYRAKSAGRDRVEIGEIPKFGELYAVRAT